VPEFARNSRSVLKRGDCDPHPERSEYDEHNRHAE
jgi:hypothetical protein